MLKLLLDEHISPAVGGGLRRRDKHLVVRWLAEWDEGRFLGADDADILDEASAQGLTLVTYDRRTIPPMLKAWLEESRPHGGVIFVDEKTIPPSDIGGLVRGLFALWTAEFQTAWANRVVYLRR